MVPNFWSKNVSVLENRSALVDVPTTRAGRSLAMRAAPNPAADGTAFHFALERAGHARLVIRDLQGRAMATPLDRVLPAGDQVARWDGRDAGGGRVSPGVYFAELRCAGTARTLRIVVTE